MTARMLLVVEDDGGVRGSVVDAARSVGLVPVPTDSLDAARRVLAETTPGSAVVDLNLPDGSGFDLVGELRQRSRAVPIMVLTGSVDAVPINRAQALGAEYVCKPDFRENLVLFLRRVAERPPATPFDGLEEALDQQTRLKQWTPSERAIVHLAATGVPRGYIAETLGVTENTLKTQVRSLLRKAACNTLAEVVWMLRSTSRNSS